MQLSSFGVIVIILNLTFSIGSLETEEILGIELGANSAKGRISVVLGDMMINDGDLDAIKLKIPSFRGKNDPKVYLECEKKVDWIFNCHN